MPTKNAAKPWFEVDHDGFRANHVGRPKWTLVRELVSNAFDSGASYVSVSIESQGRRSVIVVTDNGPGFAKIEDAYTLFRRTDKRKNPLMRGRFDSGEKELISACIEAKIETVGRTVRFMPNGTRHVQRNESPAGTGTKVSAWVSWPRREIDEIVPMLKLFVAPPNIEYVVQGEHITRPTTVGFRYETLDTVIEDEESAGLRRTRRKTEVAVLERHPGASAWLYEMGIPVQEIETPYSVDVLQKVPLSMERNLVTPSYLQDVYRIVLEVVAAHDVKVDLTEGWVTTAVEDDATTQETLGKVVQEKFGNAVLWSSNTWSNEQAAEHGMEVVHPRHLTPKEREHLQQAGLRSAGDVFQRLTTGSRPCTHRTPEMERASALAKWLAWELQGNAISVEFLESRANVLADYGDHTLRFNMTQCRSTIARTDSLIGLIIHEIAHERGDQHDANYRHYEEQLAGAACILAMEKADELRKLLAL